MIMVNLILLFGQQIYLLTFHSCQMILIVFKIKLIDCSKREQKVILYLIIKGDFDKKNKM